MSDKKQSDDLYKLIQDSSEKFEYFVPTVAGALFAFVGQHYEPRKFAFDASLFEPATLLLLGLSFYFGLSRFENVLLVKKINYKILTLTEDLRVYVQALIAMREGKESCDMITGEIATREAMEKKHAGKTAAIEKYEADGEKLQKKGVTLYKWRNRFLLLGMLSLFASKIIPPYFPTKQSATQTPATLTAP